MGDLFFEVTEVESDDFLNIRGSPSARGNLVHPLPPTGFLLKSTDDQKSISRGWRQVQALHPNGMPVMKDGVPVKGWVDASYLKLTDAPEVASIERPAALGGRDLPVTTPPAAQKPNMNGVKILNPDDPPAQTEPSAPPPERSAALPLPSKPELPPAPAVGHKCSVHTASYGGLRTLITRTDIDGVANYHVLDVNEGSEKREVDAFLSAYANTSKKDANGRVEIDPKTKEPVKVLGRIVDIPNLPALAPLAPGQPQSAAVKPAIIPTLSSQHVVDKYKGDWSKVTGTNAAMLDKALIDLCPEG